MTTILVTGPRWAGVSSLVAVLQARLQHVVITEVVGESVDQPVAVVFVVSAVAPVTDSDRDLIRRASGHADLVVGALSKIDAHRRWREVLAANRILLAERGDRYRDVPWVGVSSAPELGAPSVDDLVAVLVDGLADPDLMRRNSMRVNESRVDCLRDRRREIVRSGRAAAPTARVALHEARVRLTFLIRTRSAEISSSLRRAASEVPRRGAAEFEAQVRAAAEAFIGEVDAATDRELDAVAATLSTGAPGAEAPPRIPEISRPRRRTDRLQLRLTAVLGAGFGVGVALAASRLIVGVHGSEVAGLVAGGLVGGLAATWVIGARVLLQHRATLDRWVGEVVAALRARGSEAVSSRLLAAEAVFAERLGARDEARAARLRAIDAELRLLEQRN